VAAGGSTGQVLAKASSTDYDTVWVNQSGGGGGGGISYSRKTANYTASAGEGVIADTSGGIFTVTLPASPSAGDQVVIADGANFNTNNLTVARNGSTIEGLAENLVLDIAGVSVQFLYDGTTWKVFTTVGYAEVSVGVSTGKAIAMSIVFGG
jgi:hypothetical protein